jgi:hypothetical protein
MSIISCIACTCDASCSAVACRNRFECRIYCAYELSMQPSFFSARKTLDRRSPNEVCVSSLLLSHSSLPEARASFVQINNFQSNMLPAFLIACATSEPSTWNNLAVFIDPQASKEIPCTTFVTQSSLWWWPPSALPKTSFNR